jgi:hypothetical protein
MNLLSVEHQVTQLEIKHWHGVTVTASPVLGPAYRSCAEALRSQASCAQAPHRRRGGGEAEARRSDIAAARSGRRRSGGSGAGPCPMRAARWRRAHRHLNMPRSCARCPAAPRAQAPRDPQYFTKRNEKLLLTILNI